MALRGFTNESLEAFINKIKSYVGDRIDDHTHSWNDLEDKPFYEERVEVLPETTVEIDPDSSEGYLMDVVNVVVGNTYTVVWNGVEYPCTAASFDVEDVPVTLLGNIGAATGEGMTEEPFLLTVLPTEIAAEMGAGGSVVALDGSTSVTVSIKELIAKTLDSKYLPEALQFGTKSELVELLPESELPFDEKAESFFLPDTIKFEVGKIYNIAFNGTEYECSAASFNMDGMSLVALGNLSEMTGVESSIPFIIVYAPVYMSLFGFSAGVGSVVEFDDSDSDAAPTMKIVCNERTITPVDSKYLEPFEVRRESEKTIFPETELELHDGNFINPVCGTDLELHLDLKTGENYTVYVDGVAHTCTARSVDYDGVSILWLGNLWLLEGTDVDLGGEDTGESFCVVSIRSIDGAFTSVINRAEGTIEGTTYYENHTFRIMKDAVNEVKLKPECYGLEWSPNATMVEKEILPETEITANGLMEFDGNVDLIGTKECTVTFNGVEYVCTTLTLGQGGLAYAFVGDVGLLEGQPQGNYPFCVVSDSATNSMAIIVVEDGTISISVKTTTYEPLPYHSAPAPYTFSVELLSEEHAAGDGEHTYRLPFHELEEALEALKAGAPVYIKYGFENLIVTDVVVDYVDNMNYLYMMSRTGDFYYYIDGHENVGSKVIPDHSHDEYATEQFVSDAVANIKIPEISYPVTSVNGKTGAIQLGASDVGAMPNTTKIPNKTSDLTNDSGYITGFTEIDPTVPAWAKAATKPVYTADEVGAAPASHSHTEYAPKASPVFTGSISLGRKADTTIGSKSVATGYETTASGDCSHAEGYETTASGRYSHAEGKSTTASGAYSHAEGGTNSLSARTIKVADYSNFLAEDVLVSGSLAKGDYSHAEGVQTYAHSIGSHAEGNATNAFGIYSHAEGYETTASSDYSHAEGYKTTATGIYSHAEGRETTASGGYSHTEGCETTGSGMYSHAEGFRTNAFGECSHVEGYETTASGGYSHAEGYKTTAQRLYQHVQGKYNILDTEGTDESALGQYAHIVGNGTTGNNRSNAHTLDWDGNAWFAGDVYVGSTGGKNKDDGSVKLATIADLESAIGNAIAASY